jgi:hypothetical protein
MIIIEMHSALKALNQRSGKERSKEHIEETDVGLSVEDIKFNPRRYLAAATTSGSGTSCENQYMTNRKIVNFLVKNGLL